MKKPTAARTYQHSRQTGPSRGGAGRNLNSVTGLPPTYLCVDELGGVRFFLVAQHIGLSAQQASP
jgi:hypothetical protein